MKRFVVVAAVVGVLLAGCAHQQARMTLPTVSDHPASGTLEKAERLGSYTWPTVRLLVWWAGLPDSVAIGHGVRLYRLCYWTTGYDGALTIASGLVALPKKAPLRGVVAYQHGTTTNRHETPSRPTLGEGVLGAAIFAGGGYVFVAPDYMGLGAGRGVHPYLHARSTANAVVDLLKASKTFVETIGRPWPSDIYLAGFSQGGHAALAAQRALESLNDPAFRVAASAPVAGAYNLAGISFPVVLEGASRSDSLYLAYLINAYCVVYGHPVSSVMAEPCAALAPTLFDGEHDGETIIAALPPMPREMLSKEFLDAYDNGRAHWFLDALAENEVFQWSPRAPTRLYFGERDTDVSPKEARAAFAELSRRGGDVRLMCVGPYDHEQSVMHAIPQIRRWFDELADRSVCR